MFDTGRVWECAGSRDWNEPITSQQEKNRFAVIRFAVVQQNLNFNGFLVIIICSVRCEIINPHIKLHKYLQFNPYIIIYSYDIIQARFFIYVAFCIILPKSGHIQSYYIIISFKTKLITKNL
jgi:hypothetical protein